MSQWSATDHAMMARALQLAERGAYTTKPNPMVGCVIARKDKVVGEGYHLRVGEPHAEVHALREAGVKARGATAYVTLEPCAHMGRTPPCADALVAAGITRVVAACRDPFASVDGEGYHLRVGEPHAEVHALREAGVKARGATAYVTLEPCAHMGRTPPCADALVAAGITRVVAACRDPFASVDGEGFRKLMAAGVLTETGLMQAAGRELNRGFFSRIERGRPWVRVKLAMSLDGRTSLANGESKWITSRAARSDVQAWRARAGAILTGSGTVLADDPQLTARLADDAPVVAPLRVVLDTRGRLPGDRRVFDDTAATLAVHALDMVPDYGDAIAAFAVPRDGDGLDLHAMLSQLAQRDVNEVQVEAGATLCGALFRDGLVDELLLYIAPVLLGDKGLPLLAGLGINLMSDRHNLELIDSRQVGPDLRLLLRPVR